MSKYYTPSIEEFHIGFRFEHEAGGVPNTPWDNEQEDGSWIKSTINRVGSRDEGLHTSYPKDNMAEIEGLDQVYVRNTFRVKYLDKDDIEELGWVRHFEPSSVTTGGVPELYEILITKRRRPKRFKLSRGGALISVNTIEIREYVTKLNSKLIFRGEIKNYNELKRLMTQIGIV